jgi:Uma2 family endonuclease
MVKSSLKPLSVEEFLALPEGDVTYEFINGEAVPKYKNDEMSPKFFHSRFQKTLLINLDQCFHNKGRVEVEWAVKLKLKNENWIPVPDLLYISYNRLPSDWLLDEACPVPPELVMEIISPGQTFGEMSEKAADYLSAGVSRVWVVDTQAKTITVFAPASVPITYGDNQLITYDLFPELEITPSSIFQRAGLII